VIHLTGNSEENGDLVEN